ncbi:hypothetical protein [Streptomyces sp. NPDC058629]|uniref:hypothetical protein n=1 Tax=Streptomyces sp. NPDC058629 TaxID=3346565 RepID=UPI00364DEA8C
MSNAATVSQILKANKVSEHMLQALYTGKGGGVVVCNVRTELALVARELIHPTESTLTPKGVALLTELGGQDVAAKPSTHGSDTPGTAADLPEGTRVMSPEGRMGTVNGLDIGRVTIQSHDNYGREYIGVKWDAIEGEEDYLRRARPFVDELRIVRA